MHLTVTLLCSEFNFYDTIYIIYVISDLSKKYITNVIFDFNIFNFMHTSFTNYLLYDHLHI